MRYPRTALIEVTNHCNADCLICGRRWWKDRKLEHMPFDRYVALLDQLECVEQLHPGAYGEPLLYPWIANAVIEGKQRGLYTWLTTNGALLDGVMARNLLHAGLDKLIVSVDQIDAEAYEKARPTLKFETVLDNIVGFVVERALPLRPLATELIVNVTGDVDQDLYRKFWLDLGVDGVGFNPEMDVSPMEGIASGEPIDCSRPFDTLVVRVDGTVVLCCRDCHCSHTFGNAFEEHPLDVFNSDEFELGARLGMESGCAFPAMCIGCRPTDPNPRPPRRAP